MSMKSKFRELLLMGAMAQTMAPPAQEGTSPRKRKYAEGGTARFPRGGKQPANWHAWRRSRRKLQKASRKRNRHA